MFALLNAAFAVADLDHRLAERDLHGAGIALAAGAQQALTGRTELGELQPRITCEDAKKFVVREFEKSDQIPRTVLLLLRGLLETLPDQRRTDDRST